MLPKLTDEEFEALVPIIAERMKNVVFMNAKQRAREAIEAIKLEWESAESEDSFRIEYKMKLKINDLLEIVGGIRRNAQKSS